MSASPPTYEMIASFMARYTAKLPTTPCAPECGVAPYDYSGCDYALVLHACFPNRCVDLTRLCWSPHPLAAQLEGNLAVFCEAARGLALPDAPVRSLSPAALRPVAACVLHHVKVQQWLTSLGHRFPPAATHADPTTTRALQRWRQLGTPFLTVKRGREGDGGADAETGDGGKPLDAPCLALLMNDPERRCTAADATPCLAAASLRELDTALADTPAYTTPHDGEGGVEAAVVGRTATGSGPAGEAATGAPRGGPGEKGKPWLSYSKPWRLPAMEAAQARRAKAEAAAERRREELRRADPSRDAFAGGAANLREQLAASQAAVDKLYGSLREAKASVMEEVLRGRDNVDFAALAARLKQAGLVPEV